MPKSIIVYLIRGHEESISLLERSLSLLKQNFLPWSPADIIVFHEDNLHPSQLVGRTAGLPIKTAMVDFSSVPKGTEDLSPMQRGYRHMCHFFANDIFFRKELSGYDYYMRMDDDSYVMSPLKENVFLRMSEFNMQYAYRVVLRDHKKVCAGLESVVRSHFREASPNGVLFCPPPYKSFYNNFEICHLQWFRGASYQNYFSAIDKANGIWEHRWGDAPIRYYGVMNLLPQEAIWCVKELHYRHQSEWLPGYNRRTLLEAIRYYSKMALLVLKSRFR